MKKSLVILFALSVAQIVFAQELHNPNSKYDTKIKELEEKISRLQKEFNLLKSEFSKVKVVPQEKDSEYVQGTGDWKVKENWRALKKGMSRQKVKSLLGEPDRITLTDYFEYWKYGNFAEVIFYTENDIVYSWYVP